MPHIEDETFEFNMKGQREIRQGRIRSRAMKGIGWKDSWGEGRNTTEHGILRKIKLKKCHKFMMHISKSCETR